MRSKIFNRRNAVWGMILIPTILVVGFITLTLTISPAKAVDFPVSISPTTYTAPWKGITEPTTIFPLWTMSVPPWDWVSTGSEYDVRLKESLTSGQIIEFCHNVDCVTFQPMALNWTNDLSQIQQVSMPQSGAVFNHTVKQASWTGAYGINTELRYILNNFGVKKELQFTPSSLTSPFQYILDGGNPMMELNFVMDYTSSLTVYIDGQVDLDTSEPLPWDESSTTDSLSGVRFVDSLGETRFLFEEPTASDLGSGATAKATLRLKEQGSSFYVSILLPYEFILNATGDVVLDPPVTIGTYQMCPVPGDCVFNYDGTAYAVLFSSVATSLSMFKEDVSSFTEQDSGDKPTNVYDNRGYGGSIDSSGVIHIAYWIDADTLYYINFDTTTSQWGTATQIVADSGEAAAYYDDLHLDVSVDSSDYPFVCYTPSNKITGGINPEVYMIYNNGSWQSPVAIATRAAKLDYYTNVSCDHESDDRLALVYGKYSDAVGSNETCGRTRSSAGTLDSEDCITDGDHTQFTALKLRVLSDNSVGFIYRDANSYLAYSQYQSGANPTMSTPYVVTDANGAYYHSHLSLDGSDIYILFKDTNDDLAFVRRESGTWYITPTVIATPTPGSPPGNMQSVHMIEEVEYGCGIEYVYNEGSAGVIFWESYSYGTCTPTPTPVSGTPTMEPYMIVVDAGITAVAENDNGIWYLSSQVLQNILNKK